MANIISKQVKPRIRKLAPLATARSCQIANSIRATTSYKPTVRFGCIKRQADQITTTEPRRFVKSMAVMSGVDTARFNANASDSAENPVNIKDAVQGVMNPAVTIRS